MSAAAIAVLSSATGASAAPGDLDPAFGTDGTVAVSGPAASSAVADAGLVAAGGPAADPRIVVGRQVGALTGWGLVSLRADGSVAWQATAQASTFPAGNGTDTDKLFVFDVAIAPDGRTYAVGRHGAQNLAIAAYKSTGVLDAGFDGDGKLVVPNAGLGPVAAAVQADGRLVVATAGSDPGGAGASTGVKLRRFTTAGAPDPTFGTGGVATAPGPACCAEHPRAVGLSAASIFVAGDRFSGDATAPGFVRRFSADGAADAAFDADVPGPGGPAGVAIDSSGRVVTAGAVGTPPDQSPGEAFALRLLSSGGRDTAFGSNGYRSFAVRAPDASRNLSVFANGLAVAGTKVFVGGTVFGSGGFSAFVTRLSSDGSVDPAFGPAAASPALAAHVVPVDGGVFTGLAVQADGKVVVAGRDSGTVTVARLLSECVAFTCQISVQVAGGGAVISSQLLQNTSVGILVRRRSGKRLRTIGRVPLGRRQRGRNRIRWNLRVNGRRLPPGRYTVTLRALNARGKVFDLSRPATITVPRP